MLDLRVSLQQGVINIIYLNIACDKYDFNFTINFYRKKIMNFTFGRHQQQTAFPTSIIKALKFCCCCKADLNQCHTRLLLAYGTFFNWHLYPDEHNTKTGAAFLQYHHYTYFVAANTPTHSRSLLKFYRFFLFFFLSFQIYF